MYTHKRTVTVTTRIEGNNVWQETRYEEEYSNAPQKLPRPTQRRIVPTLQNYVFIYRSGWFNEKEDVYNVAAENEIEARHKMNQRFPHDEPIRVYSRH